MHIRNAGGSLSNLLPPLRTPARPDGRRTHSNLKHRHSFTWHSSVWAYRSAPAGPRPAATSASTHTSWNTSTALWRSASHKYRSRAAHNTPILAGLPSSNVSTAAVSNVALRHRLQPSTSLLSKATSRRTPFRSKCSGARRSPEPDWRAPSVG